ncbi:MAG: hypothetical protein ACREAE_05470 [Nitrosopumilaceae archaeon]
MSSTKTAVIGLISIVVGIAIVISTFIIHDQMTQRCESENGVMTGYLTCTIIFRDFASEDHVVTLTGDDAWRVCSALNLPCPLKPTFQAKQGGNDTFIVVVEGMDKPYTVTLNDTTTCVDSTPNGTPACFFDNEEK